MGLYSKGLNMGLYHLVDSQLGRKISFVDPNDTRNRPIRFMVVEDDEGHRKIPRKGWFLPEYVDHATRKDVNELRPVEVYELGSVEDFLALMENPNEYLNRLASSGKLASFLGFKERTEEFVARATSQDESLIDMLLLDIRMDKVAEPGKGTLDGLDAVTRVVAERERNIPNPSFLGFPVVLLTAYANQLAGNQSQALSRSDGLISKPVDPASFKEASLKFLNGQFIDLSSGRNYFTDRYKPKK